MILTTCKIKPGLRSGMQTIMLNLGLVWSRLSMFSLILPLTWPLHHLIGTTLISPFMPNVQPQHVNADGSVAVIPQGQTSRRRELHKGLEPHLVNDTAASATVSARDISEMYRMLIRVLLKGSTRTRL